MRMSRGKRSKSLESKGPQLGVTTLGFVLVFVYWPPTLQQVDKESREHTLKLKHLKHYTAALSVICASYFGDNRTC